VPQKQHSLAAVAWAQARNDLQISSRKLV